MSIFSKNDKGLLVLDTEEKLQEYMNSLLMRAVDLYYVSVQILDLERVALMPKRTMLQQHINPFETPAIVEPENYGIVSNVVVPVVRAIHARREAELKVKRTEEAKQYAEVMSNLVKEQKKNDRELATEYRSFWRNMFNRRKKQK